MAFRLFFMSCSVGIFYVPYMARCTNEFGCVLMGYSSLSFLVDCQHGRFRGLTGFEGSIKIEWELNM